MIDLSSRIREVEKFHDKLLTTADKSFKKALKDINENLPKLAEGAKQLEAEEEKNLSKGIDAAAKASKMHFKATKALGDYARFLKSQLSQYPQEISIKEADSWSFERMKSWLKDFNKLINGINDERVKANKIMGIDYVLKRRVTEAPLNKLIETRDVLRQLLGYEFQIKKQLEDLEVINGEVKECSARIESFNNDMTLLEKKDSEMLTKKSHLEAQINSLENEGAVKVFRDLKIDFQTTELDIGHQINPLKKAFRSLSNKGPSLQNVGAFEIGAAKQYEDDAVVTFHSDSANGFQMLHQLCMALISNAEELDVKLTLVHRIKQLQLQIANGKLNEFEAKTKRISEEIARQEKDEGLAKRIETLDKTRNALEGLKNDLQKLRTEMDNVKTRSVEEEGSNKARIKRFDELVDQALTLPVQQ